MEAAHPKEATGEVKALRGTRKKKNNYFFSTERRPSPAAGRGGRLGVGEPA